MDRHELIPPPSSTMQDPQGGRPSLQGKLRLKRSNSDSTQALSGLHASKTSLANEPLQPSHIHKNDQLCHKENCQSEPKKDDDDSLADFKSPKRAIVRKPISSKYQAEKTKRKTTAKSSSSSSRSGKSHAKQPSIEFSLMKTSNENQPDLKEAVPCPVCLKPFKDDATCTNHMKSCAAKNNVSIKQLLEAKSLQDRQAQERKAIGLLAAPVLAEKKKAFRSKNFSTGDDPQLELVLAMSESLYEAEKMVKLEEAALLAGFPVECVKEMSDEERKKTLQSFGFTTSKPISDPPATSRQRKKKLLAPTALQTRTKADKDRVLTERIACILTGDDALTQVNTATVSEKKACTVINSQLLKHLEQTHNKLWDRSRLTKQPHNFYVDVLKPHFIKSAQQPVESQFHEPLVKNDDKPSTHTYDTSVLYDPMDLDIIMNNPEVEQTDGGQQQFNMDKSKCKNLELEFRQNLSNNWKETLNDSSASDVLIFVKNNKHIYAHKLVFHVQCPNILLDIESMNAEIHPQIERKISWLDKEQTCALAFLEFIYSGTICKYVDIFDKKELVQQVQQLARLYQVQDLFTYVRKKQRLLEHDEQNHVLQGRESPSNKQFGTNKEIQAIPCEIPPVTLDANPSLHLKETSHELVAKKSITPKNSLAEHPIDRRITASPDLFDSDEDQANVMKVKVENNSDLEDGRVIDEHAMSSQKTLVNLSRSVSPVENIHEAITPPSGRSPARGGELFKGSSIFNQQEIAEALTPKCRSPDATTTRAVNVKQQVGESPQDDLCNAVTPEHISMAELNDDITPKKLVYTNMEVHDTASPPQMDVDESIYTAVTPPRLPDKKSAQTIDVNALKIKSELTMFIEKVQRINAKDIMETDSEADTPDNRARRKNPFSKREQDDSCRYLRNVGKQKYHKAISLLEKDVLNDEREKDKLEEVESDTSMKNANAGAKGDSITQTDIDVTVDEAEMSMYSKYKRSAQDHQNSIAVYRKKLHFSGQNSCIDESIVENGDSSASNSKSDRDSQDTNKPKPRIIEDITLVSDSDEEKSPLRTLLRDKSKKKFHKTSPALPATMVVVNKKDTTADARSNLENDEKCPVDLVDEEPNKNSMVLKLKEESKNKVIDLSVDSDEDDVNGDNTFSALMDASSNKRFSCPKQLQTSINRRIELEMAEKKSEDIDAEISKILQSSQETIGDNVDHGTEKIDESAHRKSRDLGIERKKNNSSPISIVSSPEPYHLELDQRYSQKLKNRASKDKCPENGENGGNELLDFDIWNAKTPPREESPPNNCQPTPGNPSKSEDDKISVLVSSPILSQNRHSTRASQDTSLKMTSGSRNKRPSPDRTDSEDVRKLKTKSASTSTLTEKTRKSDILQRASSLVTPEQSTRSSNNQKDVTPPLNFSLLDTPDLQKELKKFGLKPQSRTKAKALLTHIYKETQSQKRTSSSNSSSDEDIPPAKRQYIRSDTKQPGAEKERGSRAEKSSVIAEEMDFDDPDVANIFQNPVSIQDAFFKLIKSNRELYNQVLTYEPLPLESLHAMLKQTGFKCKINCLMDFLDEQCITFQVKTNKGDRTKKKP